MTAQQSEETDLITASASLPYRMYLAAYDADQDKLYDRTRTAFLVQAAIFARSAQPGTSA